MYIRQIFKDEFETEVEYASVLSGGSKGLEMAFA